MSCGAEYNWNNRLREKMPAYLRLLRAGQKDTANRGVCTGVERRNREPTDFMSRLTCADEPRPRLFSFKCLPTSDRFGSFQKYALAGSFAVYVQQSLSACDTLPTGWLPPVVSKPRTGTQFSVSPTAIPRPRCHSMACMRRLPKGCTSHTRTAPNPQAITRPSESASRTSPG